MTLSEKIRLLRNAKGWSSGQLAKAAGVSRGYLWQLETGGKDRPSVEYLERIAKALGVGVTELMSASVQEALLNDLPAGLRAFIDESGQKYGITESDIDVLRHIHFRGDQPDNPEDWELLFLFLRKWSRG